jgi:microcin C transport system substrate-binding protein
LKVLKEKGHPIVQQLLRDFAGAHAPNDTSVIVTFASGHARDLPLFVSWLPIFSRAYYAAHPFEETTLEPPLGCGPYKVGRFEPGRYIEYERVKDWWGADLPVGRGQHNFDVVRFEYYRDRDVAFEGFTSKSYLFREELVSRVWATRYDFPAIRDGRVKRDVIPDHTPSAAQGWFFNTRREKFKDMRLREAFINAFDFQWTNMTIMDGAYQRTHSVFQNSDMMALGRPQPDEVALREPFRGKVADEVFGEPFLPPEIAHLVAHVLRDRGVELRFKVGELVLDRIRLALGEERRAVELTQLLLGQAPHEVGHVYLARALAWPAGLAH